jgi:hypothetical protein
MAALFVSALPKKLFVIPAQEACPFRLGGHLNRTERNKFECKDGYLKCFRN